MTVQTQGPLQGLRVLDFSTLLPGPFATMMLADMGAEVIRVEAPKRPDMLRGIAPFVQGESAAHLTINRNKQSLALDLKKPAALAAVHKLLPEFDIVVEQFRPGVMDKLGLGYQQVQQINPGIIYCSITGYGQTGPLSDKAGHDINYLALSGLASYSGRKQTGPVLGATQVADIAAGSQQGVIAILAAVIQRGVAGLGQHLDISMSDGALALNAISGAMALASGLDASSDEDCHPQLGREMLNGGSFYDYYRTADGRYFAVGSLEPQFAQLFFDALGHPQWLGEALSPPGEQEALKLKIAKVFAQHNFDYWQAQFSELDCCCDPVLSFAQACEHPHFIERGMLQQVAMGEQRLTQLAPAVKFSTSNRASVAGAKLGEHTQTVLLEAGFTEAEIKRLIDSGAAFQA